MKIKAVVFDLGGTLIEYAGNFASWPDLETPGFMAAYNYLKLQDVPLPRFLDVRDTGFKMLPGRWQEATAGIRNLRLVDLLSDVLRSCGVEFVPQPHLAEAAELYQSAVRAQARLMPAARETLIKVKSQGYKVGLVSNTMFTGKAHQEDLERFGLTEYFDTMLFSADVNKWKPNVAPFSHVLAELDVEANAAVYVGDDPASDVVGGRRTGMCTIHIQSSQRFRHPIDVQPDAQIQHLSQLLPVLSACENSS